MKVAHKKGQDEMSKKYPIEAETIDKIDNLVQENNYWKGRNLDELRKKYIQFNVLVEYLNDVLELPQDSKFSDLGKRSYELVTINMDKDETK